MLSFEKMPEPIKNRLDRELAPDEHLQVAIRSDMHMDGTYGDAWLMATDKAILSLESLDGGHKLERFPLAEVEAVRIHNFIGNGVLEIKTKGRSIEAARYSRTVADRFDEALAEFRRLVATAEIAEKAPEELSQERVDRATAAADLQKQAVAPEAEAAEGAPKPPVEPSSPEEEKKEKRPKKRRCDKCGRAFPEGTDFCVRCLPKVKILRRLLKDYVLPFRGWVLLLFVIVMVSVPVSLIPPRLIKRIVDEGMKNQPSLVIRLGFIWLALIFLSSLIGGARYYVDHWLGQRIVLKMRRDVYRHLQKLSLSFYESKETGNLLNRVTSDTDRLNDFLGFWAPEFAHSLVMLVAMTFLLFSTNARLAAFTILPVPIMAVATYVLMKYLHPIYHKVWRYWASLASFVTDTITGVRVVKAFAQEGAESKRFDVKSDEYYNEFVRSLRLRMFWMPSMEFLIFLGFWTLYVYGGWLVSRSVSQGPEESITIGTIIMFGSYLSMFYWPVRSLTFMNEILQRAATSGNRVYEVLDTRPQIQNIEQPVEKSRVRGAVEFRNVTFAYEGGELVLRDVSFSVQPGEMIGIVGPTGAGKTTLVNLIARFYDVQEGAIYVDGVNVKDLELKAYRDTLGMVLQDPFLFSGTAAANVAYGKRGASRDEVIAAARAANAHDFILKFPDSYDSEVGERGSKLSGGEKQRVSIARAILKDPSLLILDEATSSVDTETESKIQQALERLVKGRTTFAIAHRLSTLKLANRLIVLENGKLAEMGTHDELLTKDGVYARLCKLQAELSKVRAV